MDISLIRVQDGITLKLVAQGDDLETIN